MQTPIRYAESDLPTRWGEFRLVVYQIGDEEAIALVYGDLESSGPTLARVHSECLTGEVFGSLRCDCRAQLERALERIAKEGRGVLVYLRQEGRGIGLGNKVRAYALQDEGSDTVDANLALGFEPDMRTYECAAAILCELGVDSVRLMTNNPAKIEELERAGIDVVAHEPHWVDATEHSEAYLEAKRRRMGHLHDGVRPPAKKATGQ